MRYISPVLVLMVILLLQAPAAQAIPMTFVTTLSGAAEIPLVNSPATGQATVVLDPTANTLEVQTSFRDTLKKSKNATVRRIKSLILRDPESAARNFSVFPLMSVAWVLCKFHDFCTLGVNLETRARS